MTYFNSLPGGTGAPMTGSAIRDSLNAQPRHFTLSGSQWHDSLKVWTFSINDYAGGTRLRYSQGNKSSTNYWVNTWYPTTVGLSTSFEGYSTGKVLEYLDAGPTYNGGFYYGRDSLNRMVFGRRDATSYPAYFGGMGFEFRMIPDRNYGAVSITNKLDANGNVTFYGGDAGGTWTRPHGLFMVYRTGIRSNDGVLNYQPSDDIHAIKAEHLIENTSVSGVSASGVQGTAFTTGTSYGYTLMGISGALQHKSSGTVSRGMGGEFGVVMNNVSGTIDTAFGIFSSIQGTNGTINRGYGVYVRPLPSIATRRWAGYFAGLTDSVVVEGFLRVKKILFNDGTSMTTVPVGGGGGTWGTIVGSLPNQTDLRDSLDRIADDVFTDKGRVKDLEDKALTDAATTGNMIWKDGTSIKNVTVSGTGGSFSAGTLTLTGGGSDGNGTIILYRKWGADTLTWHEGSVIGWDSAANGWRVQHQLPMSTAGFESAGDGSGYRLTWDNVAKQFELQAGGGGGSWGSITGTLSAQTDLDTLLDNRLIYIHAVEDSLHILEDTLNARTNRTGVLDTSGMAGKTSTTMKLYLEVVGGKIHVKVGTDQTGGGGGTWGTITGTLSSQTDLDTVLTNRKNQTSNLYSAWSDTNGTRRTIDQNLFSRMMDSLNTKLTIDQGLYSRLVDSLANNVTREIKIQDSLYIHRMRFLYVFDSLTTHRNNTVNLYSRLMDSVAAKLSIDQGLYSRLMDSLGTKRTLDQNLYSMFRDSNGTRLTNVQNLYSGYRDSNATRVTNVQGLYSRQMDSLVTHMGWIKKNIDSLTAIRTSVTSVYGFIRLNDVTNAGLVSAGTGSANLVWKTDASGNPAWRADATGGGGGASGTLDSIWSGGTFMIIERMTDSTYRLRVDSTKWKLNDTTNFQVARGHTGYVVTVDNSNPGSYTLTKIAAPYKRTMAGSATWNTLRYFSLGQLTNLTPTTMTATSGNVTFYPFQVPYTFTLDTLRWEVSTAAASASFCFGIYSNESDTVLYPSARLTQAVVYDTASAGVKTKYAGSDITLYRGLTYWLCYASNSTTPAVRGVPIANQQQLLGCNPVLGTNNNYTCIRGTRSYDWTLPASAPSGMIPIANIILPQVLARIK